MRKVIDANCKPPFAAALRLKLYGHVALASRRKRGMPLDDALERRSLERFLQLQRDSGIVRSIVPAKARGPGATPGAAEEELGNADVLALVRDHPDALAGLASFDAASDRDAAAGMMACYAQGFLGVFLAPGWAREPLYIEDARLLPFYEACAAAGRPAYVMCGGNAGPDLSYSDPVHVDRLAAAVPALKIVVSYGGWPYAGPMAAVLYRRENVWAMPDSYFPGSIGEEEYARAIRTFGSERFLYGSNYPVNPVREHLAQIDALGLPGRILERFLYGNAAELFGIG